MSDSRLRRSATLPVAFLLTTTAFLSLLGGVVFAGPVPTGPSLHNAGPGGTVLEKSGRDEIASAPAAVISAAADDQRATEFLDELVNGIGPRLTASSRDVRACEWARDELKAMGLDARMEKAGEFAVGFERGPWAGCMVAPEEFALEFGTPAWSAGTRGKVRGPAKLAPESPEDVDESFDGAWAMMPRNRGRMSRAQRRNRTAIFAALEEFGVAGYVRPTNSDTYITTNGNSRLDPNDLPTTPQVNLLKPQWEMITKKLEEGEDVELEFDIRNHFVPGPVPYYNVIADIVGTEKPDEMVIVGAHIDSWDGATGTTDDGCGVAVALEAARLLTTAGIQPRRTIRFCLWSGEEQGLLGSRAYIDAYANTLDKISGVFVFDGGPNPISGVDTTPAMNDAFEVAFAAAIDLDEDLPFEIKVNDNGLPRGIGSDHDAFLGRGVPGFFWQQDGKADWRHGIHTQFDTFDLAIEEYLEHSALVAALAAQGVADLPDLLSREGLLPKPPRRLGVYMDGMTIQNVIDGSPAAKAGLQQGDVIISVAGENLGPDLSLRNALQKEGSEKKIVVRRGEESLELKVSWDEPKPKPKKDEKKKPARSEKL